MKIIKGFEKELFSVRSNKDRRYKVDRYIVSYLDDKGIEYRKSFEFPVMTPFYFVKGNIPTNL